MKNKQVNLFLLFILLLAGFFGVGKNISASTILVEWSFPNNPDDEFADGGIEENLDKTISVIGASNLSFSYGGLKTNSARAIKWNNIIEENYWQIEFSSIGYKNLQVSSLQKSSATGPRDFKLQYKLDKNEVWTTITNSDVTLTTNFNESSFVLPAECNDQKSIYLRWIINSDFAINGTIKATGASNIDNIVVTGDSRASNNNIIPICNDKIILSEIYPFTDEFVEVENTGEEICDLDGWKISDEKNSPRTFLKNSLIQPHEKLAFKNDFGLNSTSSDSAQLLSPTKTTPIEIVKYEKPPKEPLQSFSFDGKNWQWTSKITPGAKNEFDPEPEKNIEPMEENKIYSSSIILSEIFPNPSKGGEEYIELYNSGKSDENLVGWVLSDASKTCKKYIFPENSILKSAGYLAIYKKDFKFALNNSGNESVALSNPLGNKVSKLEYTSSKKDVSYNFDGASWRWSKFLTPGAENIFNNLPTVSAKKKNKIYAGVYAEFSSQGKDADNDKLKYTWDFGDGHKSYLQNTRHKYEKPGKYTVILKVSDGSEDKMETFKVEVKKFPRQKLAITSIMPNPEGKDSENEYIIVKNNSKEKINLKDWSVATGSKSLYNHPISADLKIKPGKEFKITREFSKFTLNNKKARIELRYPDGKVAAKAEYEKKKSTISEDELYAKVDKKWQWIATKPVPVKNSLAATPAIPQENSILASAASPTSPLKISATEIEKNLGKFSANENNKEKIATLPASPEIFAPKNVSRSNQEKINFILGIQTVRAEDGIYHYTDASNYQPPEHYALRFAKNLLTSANSLLNKFFLLFTE